MLTKMITPSFGDRILLCLICCCMILNPGYSQSLPDSSKTPICLNFSPYFKQGQNPRIGSYIPPEQIRQGLEAIQPYCDCIRIFSGSSPLDTTAYIAKQMGFREVIAGAWLDRDTSTNRQEISAIIKLAQDGVIDRIVLGSETLLRNELSPQQLIDYMTEVRQLVPGIPVTTADVYGELLAHPEVIDSSDFVFYNAYPYWEGQSIDCAIERFHESYLDVKSISGNKEIIISETGWPTDGNTLGNAEPSLANMLTYLSQIRAWGKHHNIPYFWFSAFDEPWKFSPLTPVEQHWGLKQYDANLDSILCKPGVDSLLCSPVVVDTSIWTCSFLGDSADTARIVVTHEPTYGDQEGILCGRVENVKPCDFRILTYIKVGSGWWIKPTFTQPLTPITCDGNFCIDVVTGGVDRNATEYQVFLVPRGYKPPLLRASPTIPDSVYTQSVTHVIVSRTPFDWANIRFGKALGKPGDTLEIPVFAFDFEQVKSGKLGIRAGYSLELLGISSEADSISLSYTLIDEKNLVLTFNPDSGAISLIDSSILFMVRVRIKDEAQFCSPIITSDEYSDLVMVQLVNNIPQRIRIFRNINEQICPKIPPLLTVIVADSLQMMSPSTIIDSLLLPVFVDDYIRLIELSATLRSHGNIKLLGMRQRSTEGSLTYTLSNDSSISFRFVSKDSLQRTLRDDHHLMDLIVQIDAGLLGCDSIIVSHAADARASQFGGFRFIYEVDVLQEGVDPICKDIHPGIFPPLELGGAINIYPNPAKGKISLEFFGDVFDDAELEVINSMGQLVFRQDIDISPGNNKLDISDLDRLSKDIFNVRVISQSGKYWLGRLLIN